jgi:hypothetical protein
LANHPPKHQGTATSAVTCDDCFFRRAQLCALPGNTVCPTFRPAVEARVEAPAKQLRAVYA